MHVDQGDVAGLDTMRSMSSSSSRLRRRYRVMWNDDGGTASRCFFCTDFGADMTEWVELAHDTPVRIYAGIEEAYRAGHTGHLDVSALDYGTQPRRRLDAEMISACAANHWASGVDGVYTARAASHADTGPGRSACSMPLETV